jgi:hypothetical protein
MVNAKAVFTCLAMPTLGVALLPLCVTQATNFGVARTSCYDRTFSRLNATKWDADSSKHDPNWDVDDAADWRLLPGHILNVVSTVASLFGFWAWLFFSPHNKKHGPLSTAANMAQDLDRARAQDTILYRACSASNSPVSSCLVSGKLLCLTMAGELPSGCVGTFTKLHFIGNNTRCCSFGQFVRHVWIVHHRNESLVPSLSF